MLYFKNGINSDPIVDDNTISKTAMFEMLVPIFKQMLVNCDIPYAKVLVTFNFDDEEEEYVFGNKSITIDIPDEHTRSISMCTNCRFNFYFIDMETRFIFDEYMHEIFKHKVEDEDA